ncbi:MAG: J domain-containing protein, partial [Gemmobacter sp.]
MPGGARFHFGGFTDPAELFARMFGARTPFGDGFGREGGFSFGSGSDEDGDPRGTFFSFGGMPGGMGGVGGMPGGMGGMPGGMGGMGGMGGPRGAGGRAGHGKPPAPIEHPLQCTLEELYTGTTKRLRITKTITDASGQSMQVKKMLEVPVRAGFKAGTKITFEREGDELPGRIPADIVFVIQEKPHERFTREGNDLVYKPRVTLAQAFAGVRVPVPTLDGRTVHVEADELITPTTEKVVP